MITKKILLVSLLLASSFLFAQEIDSTKKAERIKFDPASNPEQDLKQAITLAQESNKRILLDVGGEWCIWCHRLDEFFENNPDIKKYMTDNFVVVKVNFSQENKNEEFLSKYPKVAGYPHLFVLDSDGKFLHSQDTGKLEAGKGHDRDKVLTFLKEWAPPKKENTNNN